MGHHASKHPADELPSNPWQKATACLGVEDVGDPSPAYCDGLSAVGVAGIGAALAGVSG